MRSTIPHRHDGRRIRVIGAPRSADWIAGLADEGYQIDLRPIAGPDDLKALERDPPDAAIIDLNRAPTRGSRRELDRSAAAMAHAAGDGRLWIA